MCGVYLLVLFVWCVVCWLVIVVCLFGVLCVLCYVFVMLFDVCGSACVICCGCVLRFVCCGLCVVS